MAIVSSVLSESTTMISSAQATESIASATWAASFLVMIVTESLGTPGVYLREAPAAMPSRGRACRGEASASVRAGGGAPAPVKKSRLEGKRGRQATIY